MTIPRKNRFTEEIMNASSENLGKNCFSSKIYAISKALDELISKNEENKCVIFS